jgi:hypothetical protein
MRTLIVCGLSAVAIWGNIAAADDWHYVKVGVYGGTPLSLQKGPDEIPRLLYQDGSSGLTYARYVNGEWQKERVNAAVHNNTYAFLIDRQNEPHIYWCLGYKVYHAKKEGANWVTKDIYTSAQTLSGDYFGAALRPNGNAYVTITSGIGSKFKLLEFDAGDRKVLEQEGPEGWDAFVATDNAGVAHVAYYIVSTPIPMNKYVYYVTWENGTWSARELVYYFGEEFIGDHTGIACDGGGGVYVGINEIYRNPWTHYAHVRKRTGPSRWTGFGASKVLYDFKPDAKNRVHYWCRYFNEPYPRNFSVYYKVDGAQLFNYSAVQRYLDEPVSVLPQADGNPTFVRKGLEQGDNNLYYWYYGTFTGVEDFAARSEAAGVLLGWRPTTAYVGFNLYRGDRGDERAKINGSLITGRPPFRYVDAEVARGITYSYELEAVKASGQRERFGPLEVTFEGSAAKAAFTLGQCRPNPATAAVTIPFSLASASAVELAIYDVAGRRLYCERGSYDAGPQELTVNVAALAPGVYVYRVKAAGGASASRKMVVGR